MKTREEIITYLKNEYGVEYDAGEVVYLSDGCVAEDWTDKNEWRIYPDEDSDYCLEIIKLDA